MRLCGFSAMLVVAVACAPASTKRDVVEGPGPDGGTLADAWGRDQQGLDRAGHDGPALLDGGSLDGHIGPRLDSGGLRDTAGLDLVIGPRRDAAGSDSRVPPPGTQPCRVWQDCAPHFGDQNSGYECLNSLCVCDPDNQMMTTCTTSGGQWLGQECFCVFNGTPMPTTDAGYPYCWWTWKQDSCEPDYWVDTSYQIEECYCCDSYGYDICEWRWIYDGYWEDGYCPAGWWEETCY